ncbi:cell cycle control protein cwf14 [Penicillium taxi]|uniref:cell cycle control protein cwf14 n=1 Tax=Penicillium taxi TaxID=168475 RepID=UPI002545020C|nr:cell cycle control protein cwf14 [Penicillium taxi]KAJ5888893.1 cell cycle control protein cwf14 [Penicillium taxi]
MPPVRRSDLSGAERRAARKAPPDGFSAIEDTILEFQHQQKDAGKCEGFKELWKVNHKKSRFVYELYYKPDVEAGAEPISRELYDYLIKKGYADQSLIAYWKKQGYEQLCCTQCVKKMKGGTKCICRVRKDHFTDKDGAPDFACVTCGCSGCASGD